MKTKHANHTSAALRLLVGVAIATAAFAAAANAQPSFAGRFKLPYEVHWGRAVLPAGEYFIRMESTAGPAMISAVNGSRAVYTGAPTIADSDSDGTYLMITAEGNERRVRSLNVSELHKQVIFTPLTKDEREVLAKAGQIKTVPLITAKK